jgi:CrcB protein
MLNLVLVMLGSAIGGGLRYGVSLLLPFSPAIGAFPGGTLSVNLAGSLVAGLVFGLGGPGGPLQGNAPVLVFLIVGLCGGFTTFSAFSLETLVLIELGERITALIYVVLSLVGGLLAMALGFGLGRAIG